ncbi:hypothetical protein M9H77_07472 [Catharanthus roseus]|uniref:Uncharacterized protein n=1 Tax=Catharanthus roseus TaxID=4058 RepID=A0ACC0BV10_CATRO|nr:hypothetical protein M9H77_07472 [Catharanthus roseus]
MCSHTCVLQALRTLFNIAHRLHNVLGPSWVLVLETLASLDRAIHSPHASTQEVSAAVPKLTRDSSGQYSDFHILSSLNSQLFESSAMMHVSAVKSLLSALRQLSHQCMTMATNLGSSGQASNHKIGNISFAVERMLTILVNNLHRVEPLWNEVIGHFLELADSSSQLLRSMALDAMDKSICSVLGSDQFQEHAVSERRGVSLDMQTESKDLRLLECALISPLEVLYSSSQTYDVRAGALKILLHVLERQGEKLFYSWPNILAMLRSVALASEKDLVTLGFQFVNGNLLYMIKLSPDAEVGESNEATSVYHQTPATIICFFFVTELESPSLGQQPDTIKPPNETLVKRSHYQPKTLY